MSEQPQEAAEIKFELPPPRESEWFFEAGHFGSHIAVRHRNFQIELLPAILFTSLRHFVPVRTSGRWWLRGRRLCVWHFMIHCRWLFWYLDCGVAYKAPVLNLKDGFEERQGERRRSADRRKKSLDE